MRIQQLRQISANSLRPLPGGMQNPEDYDIVIFNAIGDDIGDISQDMFTGTWHSPWPANTWLFDKSCHGATNAASHPASSGGIIYGDETPDLN